MRPLVKCVAVAAVADEVVREPISKEQAHVVEVVAVAAVEAWNVRRIRQPNLKHPPPKLTQRRMAQLAMNNRQLAGMNAFVPRTHLKHAGDIVKKRRSTWR